MKKSKPILLPLAMSFLLAQSLFGPTPSSAQAPPQHARRDEVRTHDVPVRPRNTAPPMQQRPNERPRMGNTNQTSQTTMLRGTSQTRMQRTFTRTTQGRHYDNGMTLRPAVTVRVNWQKPYFPRGHVYYPHYEQRYNPQRNFISPFGFYFGIVPAFISRDYGYDRRPDYSYVETITYNGNNFRGYTGTQDTNYFNDRGLGQREPGLLNAIDELHEAFRRGNIDALVALTDPSTEIAIYLKGQYEYSMEANDYLDLTRDALSSMKTLQFDLTLLHKRADGVFVVSGKHVYWGKNGQTRTVYVSYVLESLRDQWTLTQVGTAPDRVQEWS